MHTLERHLYMRDKNLAAFLALFLGNFGVHKFYLGKISAGVLYAVFSFTFIPFFLGIIDFIRLLTMDQDDFDETYNNNIPFVTPRKSSKKKVLIKKKNTVFIPKKNVAEKTFSPTQRPSTFKVTKPGNISKNEDFQQGLSLFEMYRYRDARDAFENALKKNPNHPEIYFQLASTNALLEEKEAMFCNIRNAINCGFRDWNRIKTTDALAFFRIQKEYDHLMTTDFADWAFLDKPLAEETLKPTHTVEEVYDAKQVAVEEPLSTEQLLIELKRLGEMRQNGQLSETEFLREKQKLFR